MQRHPSSVSRRTVSAGLAWSVPSVAAVAAAPAHAISPPPRKPCVPTGELEPAPVSSAYALVGNLSTSYMIDESIECDRDGEVGFVEGSLTLDNESFPEGDDPTPPPPGFAVVEQPKTDGSGAMSPTIMVELPDPVQLVVAYPTGLVDRSGGGSFFEFYEDADGNWTGDHWTAPAYTGRQSLGGGEPGQQYDIFTFTWLGERTQSTVTPPSVAGESPRAWAATTLNGTWTTNVATCLPKDARYLGAYYVGGAGNLTNPPAITTSNCAAVAADTTIWRNMWERAPRG